MNLTTPVNTIRNDIIHIIIYMSVSCILVPASRRNAVVRLGYKCPVSPTNEWMYYQRNQNVRIGRLIKILYKMAYLHFHLKHYNDVTKLFLLFWLSQRESIKMEYYPPWKPSPDSVHNIECYHVLCEALPLRVLICLCSSTPPTVNPTAANACRLERKYHSN